MIEKEKFVDIALRAVRAAGQATRSVQERLVQVQAVTKDDRSPVTVADYSAQALVALSLADYLGEQLIVGEENADFLRTDEGTLVREEVLKTVQQIRPHSTMEQVLAAIDAGAHDGSADSYWVLDPVDGTKGFLRGQQYAIALALIEGGVVKLGAMGCPNLPLDQTASLAAADPVGTIYVAVAGKGTWEFGADAVAPRRIYAEKYSPGNSLRVCESVEAAHSDQSLSATLVTKLGGESAPVRLDSQCKYAVVGRGQANLYLRLPTRKDYVEKVWDHAAGSLIALEAGAVVTDVHGNPLDFTRGRLLEKNQGVICAAAGLHEQVLAVVRQTAE